MMSQPEWMLWKERVRDANLLEAVCRQHGIELRGDSGQYLQGLCPLHDESNPSFTVYPRDQRFYCFGCQKAGGVSELVEHPERCTFMQAGIRRAPRPSARLGRRDRAAYSQPRVKSGVVRTKRLGAWAKVPRAGAVATPLDGGRY